MIYHLKMKDLIDNIIPNDFKDLFDKISSGM